MSSQSSLEIQYYEYDGFWNPMVSPLGDTDRERVRDILFMVPPDVQTILDVGCGNGIFCNFVSEQRSSCRITAVDRSEAALNYVMIPKVRGEITALPWPNASFDCVTALEVLEHLPTQTFLRARREIARLAKKYIVVSVPNRQLLGRDLTECPACKSRFDPDLHVRSFDASRLQTLFSDYGYTCQRVQEIGWYEYRIGLSTLYRIRKIGQRSSMNSPLCPICGFENQNLLSTSNLSAGQKHLTRQNPVASYARRVAKIAWPMAKTSRWIVALYCQTQKD